MVDRSQLIQLTEAIERTGMPRYKLLRRINSNGITTYLDPIDNRRRLISVDDVDRLTVPVERVPAQRARQGAERMAG